MKYLALVIVAFTLAACGGGGGGSDDNTGGTAEGLWHGTTDTGRTSSALVLDDGTYWFIYSAVSNSAVTGGFSQGNGTSSSGSFSSSNGLNFNFEGLGFGEDFTLAGAYKAMSTFNYTLIFPGSFSVLIGTSYDSQYDITPSLTAIAGTYSGQAENLASKETTTVKISSSGDIEGAVGSSGCNFTGNATTRANGNVYNVTFTFGGVGCFGLTGTVTGQAYFDASTKEFTSAAINSTRTNGFIYRGTKQP